MVHSKKKITARPFQYRRMIVMICLKIIVGLLVLLFLAGAVWFGYKKIQEIRVEKAYAMVTSELSECSELTSVKNVYSDIVSLKKTAVLGIAKSYSIVKYTAVVRAGIPDLSAGTITVSNGGTSVAVRLPSVTILGNDLMEISVFDEYNNIFVPISMQEVLEEVRISRSQALKNLIDAGLLDSAENHARQLVYRILSAMGFEHIVVEIP